MGSMRPSFCILMFLSVWFGLCAACGIILYAPWWPQLTCEVRADEKSAERFLLASFFTYLKGVHFPLFFFPTFSFQQFPMKL